MNSIYIYILIFGCIAYLIIVDESIAALINYSSRLLRFQYEKTKWIILNDPRNPIVKHLMWRRAYKLAKELQDEMERKSKSLNDNSTTDK
jgi:hypothetical protein